MPTPRDPNWLGPPAPRPDTMSPQPVPFSPRIPGQQISPRASSPFPSQSPQGLTPPLASVTAPAIGSPGPAGPPATMALPQRPPAPSAGYHQCLFHLLCIL